MKGCNSFKFLLVNYKDWESSRMKDKMEYWDRAYKLYKEGKEFHKDLGEAARCDLRRYQSEGVKIVEILAAGDSSCDKCKSLNGKQIAIKEALKTMPIPVKDCGRGFCRCCYTPVVD